MDLPNQPVVIDNGSGSIRAGFAGEEKPRVVFPNYIGRPKYTRVMNSKLVRDTFVGADAQKYRGLMALRYPMEHGIVTDWSDMQEIWEYAYGADQLNCKSAEHPVLLTEAPMNPTKNREKMMEIFFETFNVPAVHIQIQAVLGLYAAGRTTGVVLDSGDGVTHCVPVYEGFAIEPAIQRIDMAGRDVTRYLKLLLRKEGHIFHRTSEFEIVRDIKEQVCKVSATGHLSKEEKETKAYTMPDGSTIKIGRAHTLAPEVLFNPGLIGLEYDGVASCTRNAISGADFEIRKELLANIVFSGGSTLFPGFGERFLHEFKRLAPQDAKIRISVPTNRLECTFMGGSILATLDTFCKIMKTKQQYENEGKRQGIKAF